MELVSPLVRRSLGEPGQCLLNGRALRVAQLVLGQEGLGRTLQLGKEIRIDHHATNELS